jgi:Mor family transcriptional regulator
MKNPREHLATLIASAKRNESLAKDRRSGATFAVLAKKYGISRARCEQIVKRYRNE